MPAGHREDAHRVAEWIEVRSSVLVEVNRRDLHGVELEAERYGPEQDFELRFVAFPADVIEQRPRELAGHQPVARLSIGHEYAGGQMKHLTREAIAELALRWHQRDVPAADDEIGR